MLQQISGMTFLVLAWVMCSDGTNDYGQLHGMLFSQDLVMCPPLELNSIGGGGIVLHQIDLRDFKIVAGILKLQS